MTHYIRVEAVNFYNAIADANNISIIRGGSLLLKQAIEDIKKKFENEVEAISTGASIGVFKVTKEKIGEATLLQEIINFLNNSLQYRYFTFAVVDCQSDNYQEAKEILIAKIRYLQLQQLSLSDDYGETKQEAKPCEVQGIRLAIKKISIQKEKKFINEFARIKFVHGKRQRSTLYKDELEALLKVEGFSESEKAEIKNLTQLKFTNDLDKLSAATERDDILNGKIAVVYFDGNSFSGIQNNLVKTDEDQEKFDCQIKVHRRKFLVEILKFWRDPSWCFKDQIRLETLLWGGDEMLFVVPAWKGFELLNLFYKESENWQITINGKTEALTHAGGIVFCPHNTPIYKIRELAQQLADGVKNHPDEQGRKGNYFNYLTLESIDYPAELLDIFFAHKYQNLADCRGYLKPENLAKLTKLDLALIPKSQAYAMAQVACNLYVHNPKTVDEYNKRYERLLAISEDKEKLKKLIDELTQIFCPQIPLNLTKLDKYKKAMQQKLPLSKYKYSEAMMWVHLVELWDYLNPEQNNGEDLA